MTRALAAKRAGAAKPRRNGRSGRSSVVATAQNGLSAYLSRSERPLQSLAFVLPLILTYEIGWRFIGSRLLAFNLIHESFSYFGAPGTLLPAAALIGVLLFWHIACGDPWTIHVGTLMGMAVESILLTIPLFAMAAVMARWQLHLLAVGSGANCLEQIIIAMGAGIYEELIFRLILITLLNLLLIDLLKMDKTRAGLLMVVTSGICFSLYHYLGSEPFAWSTCIFRASAGIYFATIFMCRGFGVTAGSHAVYDIILAVLLPLR